MAATVVLPLALIALGLWQHQRGPNDLQKAEVRRAVLAKVVSALEARPVPTRGFDYGAVFREDDHLYAGPLAVTKARDALDWQDTIVLAASLRRRLPPAVIVLRLLSAPGSSGAMKAESASAPPAAAPGPEPRGGPRCRSGC